MASKLVVLVLFITCSGNGGVTAIRLSGQSLTGVLPFNLNSLYFLTSLQGLYSLRYLSLHNNFNQIYSLPSPDCENGMEILALDNQKSGFSGSIHVMEVRLQHNNFTGHLPHLTDFQFLTGTHGSIFFRGSTQIEPTFFGEQLADGLCDLMVLLEIAQAFGNPIQLASSWRWNNTDCQGLMGLIPPSLH